MNAYFDLTLKRYQAKFPKAMECLAKDREEMLAFYDFPAEHWVHLRTTNPIESTFASVRLRTKKSRNCGSRNTTLAMVFKLLENAQKRWRRIRGFRKLELVINNVRFQDGKQVTDQSTRNAARAPYTRFDNNSLGAGHCHKLAPPGHLAQFSAQLVIVKSGVWRSSGVPV